MKKVLVFFAFALCFFSLNAQTLNNFAFPTVTPKTTNVAPKLFTHFQGEGLNVPTTATEFVCYGIAFPSATQYTVTALAADGTELKTWALTVIDTDFNDGLLSLTQANHKPVYLWGNAEITASAGF